MSKKRIVLTRQCEMSKAQEIEYSEELTLALAKFGFPVTLEQIPIECAGTESTVELCGGFPAILLLIDEESIHDL